LKSLISIYFIVDELNLSRLNNTIHIVNVMLMEFILMLATIFFGESYRKHFQSWRRSGSSGFD